MSTIVRKICITHHENNNFPTHGIDCISRNNFVWIKKSGMSTFPTHFHRKSVSTIKDVVSLNRILITFHALTQSYFQNFQSLLEEPGERFFI